MKEVAVKEGEYGVYGGVVVCNDPFNIDLSCPAYSASELGGSASTPEQTLTVLSSFVVVSSRVLSLVVLFPYVCLCCFCRYLHL